MDPQYFRHLVGKRGQLLQQLQNECGAFVLTPHGNREEDHLLIAGPSDAHIAQVKERLAAFTASSADFQSVDVQVDQKYHRMLLDRNGANMAKYHGQFPTVVVLFEDSNRVVLKGRAAEVKGAAALLQEDLEALKHESVLRGYTESVELDAEQLKASMHGGELARWALGMARDYDVRLSLDKKGALTIQGLKKQVAEARAALLDRLGKLANQGTVTFDIDHAFHSLLIGKGGKNMKHLDKKYGVRVSFPEPEDTQNSQVTVVGPKESLAAAKAELVSFHKHLAERQNQAEVMVPTGALARIVGRKGEGITALGLDTDTRIDIDRDEAESGQTRIVISGTKEGIEAAAKAIRETATHFANEASEAVELTLGQAEKLNGVAAGAVRGLTLEGVEFHLYGRRSEQGRIVVKGRPDALPTGLKMVRALLESLDAFTSVELDLPAQTHGEIIGAGGENIRRLQAEYKVRIVVPKSYEASSRIVISGLSADVAEAEKELRKYVREEKKIAIDDRAVRDSIKESLGPKHPAVKFLVTRDSLVLLGGAEALTAAAADVEAAASAALCDRQSEFICVPKEKHRFLIGPGGANIREIRAASGGCQVNVPGVDEQRDEVQLVGSKDAIARAKLEIERILLH